MNKHFSAILAIMDAADIVPDEIRFTEDRDILIVADGVFDPFFGKNIENYCIDNGLYFEFSFYGIQRYLIKNPKNA